MERCNKGGGLNLPIRVTFLRFVQDNDKKTLSNMKGKINDLIKVRSNGLLVKFWLFGFDLTLNLEVIA